VQDNILEDMRTMLETNVLAVMALTKACLKVWQQIVAYVATDQVGRVPYSGTACTVADSQGMLARNEGHIINVGSTAGHEAYAGELRCT
jgi:NADP-dependent 3-hydroxy acid dehydrogenase YdfG